MLAVERRQGIIEKLQETGSVVVSELSQMFLVSEETIRRDLTKMEQEGILKKTYGGAFINRGMHLTVPVNLREHTYIKGKDVIGALAAEMVQTGDTIFLDASTTAIHIADRILDKKNLIVITNNLRVAETLAASTAIKTICTGGTLRQAGLSMVGKASESAIASFFADKAFLSCAGLDLTRGITDANEKEAEIRKIMMRQANVSVLVADATKFGKTSFVRMAEFKDFQYLITDKELDLEWEAGLAKYNIQFQCGSNIEST